MKAFCCECGHAVPIKIKDGKPEFGHCRTHPNAKRVSERWYRRKFDELYEAIGCGLGAAIGAIRAQRSPYLPKYAEDLIRSAMKGGAR